MKIAFYLPNAGIADVDCTQLEKGNPGIGGTEYIIQVTALYVSRLHAEDVEIVLGCNSSKLVCKEISTIEVASIGELIKTANADYVVFKHSEEWHKEAHRAAEGTQTKLLPWTHCFLPRNVLNDLANDEKVARIICVSEEQLNMYRDHRAFLKSTYIYNGMPTAYLRTLLPTLPSLAERPKGVTYIGSIVDYKGLHLLAEAWPQVLEKHPDAHLHVIGSGKLYDRTAHIGKYGIAEENYEARFMPYLTDKEGKILPSVTFHGVMGEEKNDVLRQSRVGVPNPSGISETFCITALEMQAMGCVVTTIAFAGFLNTVYPKTGLLYKDPKELADCICHQLEATDNDVEGFYDFMEENFAFEKVANDWLELFRSLDKPCVPMLHPKNMSSLSRIKERNRKIKATLPFGYVLPTIDFYRSILRRLGVVKGF